MTEQNEELLIKAILNSGIKIPPMPDVLIKLKSVLADPDAGPREVATAVQHDGSISGALFRLTGSPVFGLRVRVSSVEKAVAVLGMKTALATVRSTALQAAVEDKDHAQALEALWAHSGRIADLMLVALKTGPLRGIHPDLAYTLGMFHDCGIALLIKRFPSYAHTMALSHGWQDIPRLDHEYGVYHTVTGQMVAKNWLLPDEVALAIRHHHSPGASGLPEPVVKLCVLLQFAIHLYNLGTLGEDAEWGTSWCDQARTTFGIDASDLKRWEEEALAFGA